MKRIQLFEFEDQPWFPSWLRSSITNLIVVMNRLMGVDEIVAGLAARVLKEKNISTIVDLGSGSGGAMPGVLRKVQEKEGLNEVRLTLTDLYPNPQAIQRFGKQEDHIKYHPNPVDATHLEQAPEGLKTMVNAFHHLPPQKAKQMLRSAQENKQPLLIYEMGNNNIPTFVWWLFLPLGLLILMIMVLFLTPFVRPLSWQQLVFTYLIPIIPIVYAWDGQASLPRIYSLEDLDELLEGLEVDDYTWEKGPATTNDGKKKQGVYLFGLPVK